MAPSDGTAAPGSPLDALLHRVVRGATPGEADCFPVDRLAELAASIDAANYFSERMGRARPHPDKYALLCEALETRRCDGMIAEFGVFEGRTINFIAEQTRETVFGFDCFEGLPEDWRPGFPRGTFSRDVPVVRPNVRLIVGLFEDTLPDFLARHREDMSLLHIDCDLYSSTRTVLRACAPRIRRGTVLVFDEYFNYPGWRGHEFRAFQEFVAETGRAYEYLSLVPSHQQVAVIMTR
ncbi:class I SAM-dependent methyltransferase [Roseicella aerolata]|uniref:Class I SAM-dependent methyltransferase n=1 Tax=Roseicella aerolata TaxID=2883479 RepID=A0A9X1LCQ7_9PROT|nr:class I SAM-dependent methyltransferase [Roseicella aerolata]MCB4824348.1 class I SAM-dependent methyltransferase [Roseicella aerolata]